MKVRTILLQLVVSALGAFHSAPVYYMGGRYPEPIRPYPQLRLHEPVWNCPFKSRGVPFWAWAATAYRSFNQQVPSFFRSTSRQLISYACFMLPLSSSPALLRVSTSDIFRGKYFRFFRWQFLCTFQFICDGFRTRFCPAFRSVSISIFSRFMIRYRWLVAEWNPVPLR